jgi:hypothetical protein
MQLLKIETITHGYVDMAHMGLYNVIEICSLYFIEEFSFIHV